MTTTRLTIIRPDDWHVHLRDEAMLQMALPWTARTFGRAIVMPNLDPPVTTAAQAAAYRDRIRRVLPDGSRFEPLMTCFLTDETGPEDIARGFAERVLTAVKMYPARSTTNSAAGVTDFRRVYRVLERMQAVGMPLLIHGEVADQETDVFDREKAFIDRVLVRLRADFPALRIVLEHITTAEAVDYVQDAAGPIGATITAHHLMINRNAMFAGGIRPHMYCLPVAKRESHRLALRKAAISGDPRFFLGTDSAPHLIQDKESACGCAGIFTAPLALELYAQVFEEERALDRLAAFASLNGARFYGLPPNTEAVTLVQSPWQPPELLPVGEADQVRVFCPEGKARWRLLEPAD
ncbi:dihydroorotase [Mesorhizobium comanense]|jgi:dihydroorotase|uniref:dihydroorotase n=1 Tax=Mesorhizobium comanense TaxID=2502215 RepID=UPI0010F7FDDB|nr:dihydroorotase [Mesorhizobium comanense]